VTTRAFKKPWSEFLKQPLKNNIFDSFIGDYATTQIIKKFLIRACRMELADFCNILAEFTHPEHADDARSILESLCHTDLIHYMRLHLSLLASPGSPEQMSAVSALLLCRAVRSEQIPNDRSITESAWSLFAEFSSHIFGNLDLRNESKMTFANALAQLYVSINNSFPGNYYSVLIELFVSEWEPFIISCLADIVIFSGNLGGMPEEFVMGFLSNYSSCEASVLPRFRLFSAFAACFPKSNLLVELFPSYVQNIPPRLLQKALSILDDLSKTSAEFFGPHLLSFAHYLILIAQNTSLDAPTRNVAMFVLGSMFEGAPEMCVTCAEFLHAVLCGLVQVAAELPDGATFEPDPNDISAYRTALDTISVISTEWNQAVHGGHPLLPILSDIFSHENAPWQLQCAGMLAFASFPSHSPTELEQLLPSIVAMIVHPSTMPLLRIAGLEMVESMASPGALLPLSLFQVVLQLISQVLLMDEDDQIKLLGARILARFSSMRSTDQAVYDVFMQIIEKARPNLTFELAPYIIRSIGNLPASYGNAELLFDLFRGTESHPVLRIDILWAIAQMTHRAVNDEGLLCVLFNLLPEVWSLRTVEVGEDIQLHWREALEFFIKALGGLIEPMAAEFVQYAVTAASSAVQIEQLTKFEDVSFCRGLYERCPSSTPGLTVCASKTDIAEVLWGLHLIDCLITALCDKIRPYVDAFVEVVRHWLTCEFELCSIKKKTWSLLLYFAKLLFDISPDESLPFFGFLMDAAAHTKLGIPYEREMSLTILVLCELVRDVKSIDETRCLALFVRAVQGLRSEAEEVSARVETFQHWGGSLDEDHDALNSLEAIKMHWMSTIHELSYIAPSIIVPYFVAEILPRAEAALARPESLSSELELLTFYYGLPGSDEGKLLPFIDLLLELSFQLIPGVSVSALGCLLELFQESPLTDTLLHRYLTNFLTLISKLSEATGLTLVEDSAIAFAQACYCQLALRNVSLDMTEIMSHWMDCFDLNDTYPPATPIFMHLLVDQLAKGNPAVIAPVNIAVWLVPSVNADRTTSFLEGDYQQFVQCVGELYSNGQLTEFLEELPERGRSRLIKFLQEHRFIPSDEASN
jgi:hypothetical protein